MNESIEERSLSLDCSYKSIAGGHGGSSAAIAIILFGFEQDGVMDNHG